MKIMIADDHPLFASGLKNLIETENYAITAVVKNGEEAVERALLDKPDVILMDIKMPVLDGIEATKKIKNELSETRILILTSFDEEDSLLKAIKAGASGYLLKSLDGEELLTSLKEIEKGKNPFSAGLEDYLLDEFRYSGENENGEEVNIIFTERQMEVIKLICQGLTYQEVASELFLSERTIKYHMEQIKNKLSLNNKAQVIAYAKNFLI